MSIYLADQYSVQPIVQLFQSILLLEDFPECEEEVSLMKKRLTTLLLDVPEKKLTRKVDRLTYYPNGLCEMGDLMIVLPAWESTTSVEDVKKDVDMSSLKKINLLWYYQLKMYLNQKVTVSKANKIPAAALYAKHKTFSALSPEEKTFMNEGELSHSIVKSARDIQDLFEKHYGMFELGAGSEESFEFLTSDELEKFSLYFQSRAPGLTKAYSHYELISFMKEEISLTPSPDRVVVSLGDLNMPSTFHRSYLNDFDTYKELFFTLYERLNAIEDTTIRTILKKMGIVANV